MDVVARSVAQHPLLSSAVVGMIVHAFFHFHRPHSAGGILSLLLLPLGALAVLNSKRSQHSSFLLSFAVYLGALVLSVILYRLSPFHPLAKYPGPLICRVSRIWAWYIAKTGYQHKYSHYLHEKYGPVVRSGPNHLLIREVGAVPVVYGSGKDRWHKGARYGVLSRHGVPNSLPTIKDPQEHAQRRKLWELAFTPQSLKEYETLLDKRIEQLLNAMESRAGQVVDLAEWFGFLAFDFMGDFSYGGAWNLLEDGADHHAHRMTTREGIGSVETVGTIPWIVPFIRLLNMPNKMSRLAEQGKQALERRRKDGSEYKDLFHYLLGEEDGLKHEPLSLATQMTEATVAIIAGSDTTSTALANAYKYLLTHPHTYIRLRKEVDDAFPADTVKLDTSALGRLPYLNAVINEVLRLQPGGPNGMQRVAPPGSGPINVAGHIVPPDTTVQVPTYSLHRDPRYFAPNPDTFDPDRWLVDPKTAPEEFKLNKSAFTPFSFGATNCVGKSLALMELRLVIATMMRRFDVALAPEWDEAVWEADLKDRFSLSTGRLPVVMTVRV